MTTAIGLLLISALLFLCGLAAGKEGEKKHKVSAARKKGGVKTEIKNLLSYDGSEQEE